MMIDAKEFTGAENELIALEDYWCRNNKVAVPYIFPDNYCPHSFMLDSRPDSYITGWYLLWHN